MKRHISNILILAFLLLGTASCEVEKLEVTLGGENSDELLTFSFNARAEATTDDEIASEVGLNEDRIETLDLFFFENATSGTYASHQQFINENDNKNTTFTVPVSTADLNMNNKTYLVYAVVNRVIPKEEEETGKTYTLNKLKAMAASKTITVDNETTPDDENIQSCFVMDGEKSVTLSSNMETPVIELKRSVAKITMDIDVTDVIYVGSNRTEYYPVENSMTVRLVNGKKNGIINGFSTDTEYFETVTDEKTVNPTVRSIVENTTGNDHTPFYSYPYDWSSDASSDCYLYLTIDWTSQYGTVGTYYYIVPIGEVTQLVRNNHYIINLDVAILGGTEEEPVTLNSNYIIENWSTQTISTELKKYKYLWVKDRELVMNNIDDIDIEYASSSKISFTNLKVKRYINQGTDAAEVLTEIKDHGVSIDDNKDGTFTVIHGIIRSGSDNNLNNYYRPWYITFNVVNDDGLIVENIKITQYPAIYAVANHNPKNSSEPNKLTTFVNGVTGPTQSGTKSISDSSTPSISLGTLRNFNYGTGQASNQNMNQYKIYVTVLNSSDNYYIGDPRVKAAENEFSNLTKDSNNKNLVNYYKTGTGGSIDNTIAPAFMIASSWAVTVDVTYNGALKRCASYQENGYPAGRWRIPTEAEIKFVNGLSADGYIPELFDGDYYASSKKYWDTDSNPAGMSNQTSDSGHSVRCVYDLWYWGDAPALTGEGIYKFTWGDEEIK